MTIQIKLVINSVILPFFRLFGIFCSLLLLLDLFLVWLYISRCRKVFFSGQCYFLRAPCIRSKLLCLIDWVSPEVFPASHTVTVATRLQTTSCGFGHLENSLSIMVACSAEISTTGPTATGCLSSFTASQLYNLTAAETIQYVCGWGKGKICVNECHCSRDYSKSDVTYVLLLSPQAIKDFSSFLTNNLSLQ